MDRIEGRQDDMEKAMRSLEGIVGRVEQNQKNADKVSEMQFKTLDTGLASMRSAFDQFTLRINGLISGEIQLPQQVDLMADWKAWRKDKDEEAEAQAVLNGQVRFFGNLVKIVIGGNAVILLGGIAWLVANIQHP